MHLLAHWLTKAHLVIRVAARDKFISEPNTNEGKHDGFMLYITIDGFLQTSRRTDTSKFLYKETETRQFLSPTPRYQILANGVVLAQFCSRV